jgi:hypothetical protein
MDDLSKVIIAACSFLLISTQSIHADTTRMSENVGRLMGTALVYRDCADTHADLEYIYRDRMVLDAMIKFTDVYEADELPPAVADAFREGFDSASKDDLDLFNCAMFSNFLVGIASAVWMAEEGL